MNTFDGNYTLASVKITGGEKPKTNIVLTMTIPADEKNLSRSIVDHQGDGKLTVQRMRSDPVTGRLTPDTEGDAVTMIGKLKVIDANPETTLMNADRQVAFAVDAKASVLAAHTDAIYAVRWEKIGLKQLRAEAKEDEAAKREVAERIKRHGGGHKGLIGAVIEQVVADYEKNPVKGMTIIAPKLKKTPELVGAAK